LQLLKIQFFIFIATPRLKNLTHLKVKKKKSVVVEQLRVQFVDHGNGGLDVSRLDRIPYPDAVV
jgi:hypothetical protein